MYSYALLGKPHELWTYRFIFLIFSIITSSSCLLHSIISIISSWSRLIIYCYTSYFLHLKCCFFTYWCILGSCITLFIPSFGIDLETLAWEVVSWDRVLCVHQWFERVYSFHVVSHWNMTYWWLEYAHVKKEKKKKANKNKNQNKKRRRKKVICLYLTSYSIKHVLLFKGLLGLSLRVCASFLWGLFLFFKPFLLCIWSVESSYERFMRSYASWFTIDMY